MRHICVNYLPFCDYFAVTVTPSDVILDAVQYVQRGKFIKLNCSSELEPIGQTAEFLVDDNTITNIRNHSGTCFKTIDNQVCVENVCECGADGNSYILYYRTYHKTATFECKMRFSRNSMQTSNKVNVMFLGKHI